MSKEAMTLALEASKDLCTEFALAKVRGILEEALAKQEQGEPVAYLNPDDVYADTAFRWCKIDEFTQPVYTTPQPAQKPLTDEQIADIVTEMNGNEPPALFWKDLTRAIEAAHGIKENT